MITVINIQQLMRRNDCNPIRCTQLVFESLM